MTVATIHDCHWNAGNDRYLGTVPAAIAAYHLPIATQQSLIDQWERRQFADTVVIDRDSIRGRTGEYTPEMRGMNFGGAGRTCDTVTRAGWSADHVETAIVLCADGECIAIPSVCLNVSRITRLPDAPIAALPPFLAPAAGAEPESAGPIGNAPLTAFAAPAAGDYTVGAGAYPDGWSTGGGGFAPGGYVTTVIGLPCETCCLPGVIAAVPEIKTRVLLAVGLAAVLFATRRKPWAK